MDERYRAFIDEFSSAPASADGDEHEAFRLRTRLVHVFRRFPALDPELPDELIRAPARRADAVALFDELYSASSQPPSDTSTP